MGINNANRVQLLAQAEAIRAAAAARAANAEMHNDVIPNPNVVMGNKPINGGKCRKHLKRTRRTKRKQRKTRKH